MNYREIYDEWVAYDGLDEGLKNELLNAKSDEKEIEDRFYKDLSFGTGGLRGVIGAGSNRMNKYTVGRATQGLANFLNADDSDKEKSVAIAYDSRHFSDVFALEAALVLGANGIKAYLFDSLRPTPELSFTVRHLQCDAGIVVTASHNPPEYNGYKVYGNDGGQITLDMANGIINEISQVDIFKGVQKLSEAEALEKGILEYIGEFVDNEYLANVTGLALRKGIAKEVEDFKVIYTPIHGSGLMPVTKALALLGFENVFIVDAQKAPDGSFPTVKSPNPEEKAALNLGIELAKSLNGDIVLGTDPDSDRVGAVVNDKGDYKILTGNQIGALLTHYIMSSKEAVTSKDAVIKTIVTSELGANIARAYGATVFDTLTGFKFIGEKIKDFEADNSYDFAFGYEESYGYLSGTFVRDKDAVIACTLITEMAAYYKTLDMTLIDAINKIYEEFGYFKDALESFTYKGKDGQEKIASIVEKFRDYNKLVDAFDGVEFIEDYQAQTRSGFESDEVEVLELPKANVIKVFFKDGAWFAIRPSGTEPKLKIYYSTIGETESLSDERMSQLKGSIKGYIE